MSTDMHEETAVSAEPASAEPASAEPVKKKPKAKKPKKVKFIVLDPSSIDAELVVLDAALSKRLLEEFDDLDTKDEWPRALNKQSVDWPMQKFVDAIGTHLAVLEEIDKGIHKAVCLWSSTVFLPFVSKYTVPNTPVPYKALKHVIEMTLVGGKVATQKNGYDCVVTVSGVSKFSNPFTTYVEVSLKGFAPTVSGTGPGVEAYSDLFRIWAYEGEKTLEDLGLVKVPQEELKVHQEFGRKVLDITAKPNFVYCDGPMWVPTYFGDMELPATGRMMIDWESLRLVHPHTSRYSDSMSFGGEVRPIESATDDELAQVYPIVWGFSFASKKWGKVHISQLSEIQFRTGAFENLVLPGDDKKLILALTRGVDPEYKSDFIDGKGGGCIFLFHGNPGVGKTLTAEAIAEVLKRPLYSVSVGELGVECEELERNLQRTLQLASRWNAILLLDEVDIFLESREDGDIYRNAMVATFLRLLEYYNGVLVLTTNRVENIDPAVYSRISFARKYEDHDVEARLQIIKNILSVNNITLADSALNTLATIPCNGRQIKNSVRLVRFLARDEGREPTFSDIYKIMSRVSSFG